MSQPPPPGSQPWLPPQPAPPTAVGFPPPPLAPPQAMPPPVMAPPVMPLSEMAPPVVAPPVMPPPVMARPVPSHAWEPPAPAANPPRPRDPRPRDPRSRRRIITWVSVAAGLGLLAGGTAIAVTMINDSRDPAAQVEEYLALLANGEAEAASQLVNPGVADAWLLADGVLGAAQERIAVQSVETIDRDGGGARVLARLSLAGEEFEHEFTVDHGANELLVLETWELNDALLVEATVALNGPVSAGNMPATVHVAGAEIVLAEMMTGADSQSMYVYPGVYEVAPGELGAYLSGTGTTLVAAPGSAPTVELTAQLTTAFEDEILAQAAGYADGCVRIDGNEVVSGNMDAACPSITRNTRLSELSVTKYPQGFDGIDATAFSTNGYEFEVRGSSAAARLDRSTSTLSGSISWRDGTPSIVDAQFGW